MASAKRVPGEGLIIDRVLHPTDLTEQGEAAFVHAVRLAVAARAQLDIANVNSTPETVSWRDFPSVRQLLGRWKTLPEDASQEDVLQLGLGVAKFEVRGSDPARGLLAEVERHQPDLVVFATHGRSGIDRLLHGEVAQPVARAAAALALFLPIGQDGFVSRLTGVPRLDRVLLPVAAAPGAGPAIRALRGLVALLDVSGVHAELLHIGDSESAPELAPTDDDRIRWSYEIRPGEPVEAIQAYAVEAGADLIVLATEGRSGLLDALRGSTSERILAGVECAVLAVPAG